MLRSVVDLAREAARTSDTAAALAAVAELRRRLDELEAMHVENAVRQGWSWARIAASLGRSKQAVHKRHAERLQSSGTRLTVQAEARAVVGRAQAEAAHLGHGLLDPVHLLISLAGDPGPAGEALRSLEVKPEQLRSRASRLALRPGKPPRSAVDVKVSARVRAVFEQSLREAVSRGSKHLGPEHLLFALVRGTNSARKLLDAMGVDGAAVADRLQEALEQGRNVRPRA